MNNHKKKIWPVTAGIIFAITVMLTIGLIWKVVSLDMLPITYLAVAILAVVFLLLIILLCCFFLPFKKKNSGGEVKKTGKAKYVFRAIGMILAIALMIVDGAGVYAISQLQLTLSNMVEKEKTEINFEIGTEIEKPFIITQDPFIVYISGTDTRGSGLENVRSDVNILAVVNPSTKQVLLINTPRDYYVEISVSEDGERDKLTHCGNYGIDCSVETLENLYTEEINYYAQINFKGFTRLIDAIGGVEVYSSKTFYTTEGNYLIEKGMNNLNGDEALAYVRDRFSYGDGDAARARNQMAVISGIIDKMSSGSLLLNYADILESMGKYFGCSLTESEISALVKMQLSDTAEWDVQTFAVTGEGKSRTTYSMPDAHSYVVIPDEGSIAHAKDLIAKIYAGEEITEEDLVYTPTED